MDLSTNYLGLKLRTPLVPSASPLCESLDNLKRMEDAGASAVVLHSYFEEQLRRNRDQAVRDETQSGAFSPDAHSSVPRPPNFAAAPESYLEHLRRAKQSLGIPVIASLNGTTFGGWTTFSRQIEQAGADALELNLYSVPTDPDKSAEDIEQDHLTIIAAVKAQVKIPIAVKLSPFFTNLAHFAHRIDQYGADGLVLFNRFYQPDIDLEKLEAYPNLVLSTSITMRLPLRWIAILHGRVQASLAASGGLYTGQDALKLLMAGADVTMVCSSLLKNGIEHIATIEREMRDWMEAHHYSSVAELKGCLSQRNCHDPSAFERAQYIRGIHTFAPA